ncbi:Crp/Fnr family transcriptional regulator [Mucilaginibacter limnophilus]|uniref:Crp/Fnr family transcriptional regulator n=1 Tax=Mucilaginibacter limnophilus TaxID=1932778 RepID=A0A3S2ULX9_9SPHI|nr:Crp/Fnr family transcriptional regulator [Mucilaginibacter limnophilus]RVU01511.1 Crp/Fnr family transcriptional regulator [Mucilaginibacter limnophilus]
MIDPEKIKQFVSLFKELSFNDVVRLFGLFKMRRLRAGEVFVLEGSQYSKLAYIQKGLIRAYTVKPNGDEITVIMRWEDQFFASHDYVIHRNTSKYNYQAVEGTILFEINYDEAQKIFEKHPGFAEARNVILLNMLGDSLARVEAFVLLSPEERYVKLIKDKPNLINRVPDKYIATMLGVTPVSLSRIRKRIASVKH